MIQYQIINSCLLRKEHLFILMQYPPDIFRNDIMRCYNVLQDMFENEIEVDLPSFLTRAKQINIKIDIDKIMEHSGNSSLVSFKYTLDSIFEDYKKTQIESISIDLFKSIKAGSNDYRYHIDKIVEISGNTGIETDNYFELSDFQFDDSIGDFRAVKTGVDKIDLKFVGFTGGDISIIAARPGEGKSALAFQIAKKNKCLFFNLEMPRNQVVARMLHGETGIGAQTILEKKYSPEQEKRLRDAYARLQQETQITMFNKPMSMSELSSKIKLYNKTKDPDLIIIDYVQLVTGGNGSSTNERLSNVSRILKGNALALDKPILILSQFSREVDRHDREPKLSDLRDSGSLEQDASNILFIHKNNIIIGKSRIGEAGKVEFIKFFKERGVFAEEHYDGGVMDYIHD